MRAFFAMTALLWSACAAATAPPPDSIYQLSMPLTDQRGSATTLDRYRGQPVLISMFYSSCPHTCPLLISAVQGLEKELPPAQRGRLRVLLVSIDPVRDTPEKLAATARAHRAEDPHWTFARADELDVRRLAAVLGIQYRRLASGEFNHSSVITLLDGDGRVLGTTSSLLRPDPDFVAKLKGATRR